MNKYRVLKMSKQDIVEKQQNEAYRGRGSKLDTSGKKQSEPGKNTSKKET